MSRPVSILVVEDDAAMRESCAKLFRLEGYGVDEAGSGEEALEHLRRRGDTDIVLTDIRMPGMDGLALLKEIKLLAPTVQVVLMTGYGSVKSAVEAMKHGAADYITKPFDTSELLMTVGRLARLSGLQEEVVRLRAELQDRYRFENIVGTSMAMQRVYVRIDAASKTSSTVLICGESGTGKELVAKAIHYNGVRSDKPFVPVNCAAMPRELIESELFGHKKGAFTGAVSDAVGLFRSADGGTIFLDEVVEMPYGTQAKLLRALQERQIRPVGGAVELPVDVRVIASTNQDVTEALRADKLRTDLYYRLSVIRIDVPPLRARLDDIPDLVNHFIAKFGQLTPRTVRAVSDDALGVLTAYAWPGNVRELESAVENAFVLGKTDVIGKDDLPPHVVEQADARSPAQAEDTQDIPTLSESQWELVVRTLEATGGNKTRAARILGISRPRLYNMLRRHGMGA